MKSYLLLLLAIASIFPINRIKAQSTNSSGPSDVNNLSIPGSGGGWLDTRNSLNEDSKYSEFKYNINSSTLPYSDYLVATDFNLNIPAGVVIKGILVDIKQSDPSLLTSDYSVRIVKNSAVTGSEMANDNAYPDVDTYRPYGGTTNLWGETWTVDDVNSPNFGVAISSKMLGYGTGAVQIDYFSITVFYSFTVLPVNLVSFSAAKNNKTVDLNWTTAGEVSMDHYEVERSADGRSFSSIGSMASHTQSTSGHYIFTDQSPLTGVSYYRLMMAGTDGSHKYSKIVSMQWSTGNMFGMYPNPLVTGETLHISNPNREQLTIRFYNLTGKLITTVNTSTDEVNATSLKAQKGIVVYRVANTANQTTESGQIVVK